VSARAAGRAVLAIAAAVVALGLTTCRASAADVAVIVVPSLDPAAYAREGAVGLIVPGAGSTVTRKGALSSLVRGKVVSSLLGGTASGRPLIGISRKTARITVYVTLPPRGRTHNTTRYPIAIVGGGYRGLLVTRTTRIPGLVSIADVAPTAVALAGSRKPPIRWRRDEGAAPALARLDRRMADAHDTRTAATIVLVATTLVLAGLALLARSAFLARAGLLAIPAALAVALALSGLDVSKPREVTIALAVATPVLAFAVAWRRWFLLPALVAFIVAELVVLAVWPAVNSLSTIGPHPDGGGRYFGVTNEVETLLLAPILAAGALASRRQFIPLAALALLLVGWSRAGADGGGILVLLVALGTLWVRRERVRITPARAVLAGAGVVVLSLALVRLDALTGGSSHVTGAVSSGAGSLLGDLARRLRISWEGVTATTQAGVAAAATLVVLVGAGLLRPRAAVVDALLAALAVSLLVNDTPTDVLAYGALAATALRVWATVDERATERSVEGSYPRASPAPLSR
jgi:hypothetical protein